MPPSSLLKATHMLLYQSCLGSQIYTQLGWILYAGSHKDSGSKATSSSTGLTGGRLAELIPWQLQAWSTFLLLLLSRDPTPLVLKAACGSSACGSSPPTCCLLHPSAEVCRQIVEVCRGLCLLSGKLINVTELRNSHTSYLSYSIGRNQVISIVHTLGEGIREREVKNKSQNPLGGVTLVSVTSNDMGIFPRQSSPWVDVIIYKHECTSESSGR